MSDGARSTKAPPISAGLPQAEFDKLKMLWSLLTHDEQTQIRPAIGLILSRFGAKEAAADRDFQGFMSAAIAVNGKTLPNGPTRP